MATCAVCNSVLKPGKKFCTECGRPTSTRTTAPHLSHQITSVIGIKCAQCGITVATSKRFCTGCGNPVKLPQPQLTSAVGGDIKCAQCGAPVQAGRNFCTHCSARIIRIGRKPDNDVVLDYHMISAHHACIAILGDVATIHDLGSTSGTAIGSPDKKIQRSRLSTSDTVYFGSFSIPASRLLSGHLSLGKRPHTLLNLTDESMVLGRGPDCDVVLDHPLVAHRHARISREGDAFVVQDLGTRIGTFVNGQRISGSCTVNVGDIVGVGSYTFKFSAPNTIQQHDYRGNVTLEARGVTVDVTRKRKRIIEGISLTIYPSEIVASMGPSGAGKTTLMNALNGYMPPTSGTVLINGQDLYASYELFCGHVGYVPQDDIMHRELTVGQALYYTARLRLPADYGDAEIQTRIQSVLSLLDLDGTEDVIIGSPEKRGISGGQRKRVNLAMELLTDPSILFLDEPTSGLSSEDALMVMKILRNLANQGKTILITIHQPGLEVFRMADSLVMVSKDKRSKEPGQLVYFGPAYPDAVEFFNPGGVPNAKPGVDPSPDEVMRGLSQGKTDDWVKRYAASQHKRQYVDERLGKRPSGSAHPVKPKISREPGLSQWWTLVKRGLAIKAKDRWSTAILLAQAPIIACLLVLAFGNLASNEKAPYLGKTIVTIFLLIISAIWLGCSNAVREVVGEWAVYRRERMVNLKIPSYLGAKFTVLGGLCVIQCAILFSIIYVGSSLQGPPFLMFAVLTLASFVGLALGLILSAVAPTSEVAIGLVPLVLLPMIFLGGAMTPLQKMSKSTKPITHLIPARWAFEGLLLLENKNREFRQNPKEDLSQNPGAVDYFSPEQDRFGTPSSVIILGAMLVMLIGGIMTVLKIRDIH